MLKEFIKESIYKLLANCNESRYICRCRFEPRGDELSEKRKLELRDWNSRDDGCVLTDHYLQSRQSLDESK